MRKIFKSLIFLLIPLCAFSAFSAPQQPMQGGTGVANNNANTISINAPLTLSGSSSSAFNIDNATKGARPYPVKTEVERDAITSPESGLTIYNSTTQTLDYFDGAVWQKILLTHNINAGANVTVTDNGDGTVTISATGGGDIPAPAYSAYSVHNNTAPRPNTGGAFVAVPVSGGFTSDQEACFTNSIESVGGINTPISIYTCSETQFFEVDQSASMQGVAATFRQYIYAIAIKRAGGSLETTNYRMVATQNSDIANDHPTSMHGIVQLNQGDGVFTQIYGSSSDQTAPTTYITSKVASMAGSAQPNFQNIYENSSTLPTATLELPTDGEFSITYPTDQTALSAGSTGITSTLGLRLVPSGLEDIRFLQTLDPTSTIAEIISTTRGAKPYPAMTFVQGAAIGGTKPIGLGFYNTSTNTLSLWTGSEFTSLVNSTGAQTIAGSKTFSSNIVGNLTGTAAVATTGTTVATSANASFYPLFVASNSNSNQIFNLGSNLSFNPATNNLTTTTFTGNLTGTATTATQMNTTATTSNTTYFPGFFGSSSTSNQSEFVSSRWSFNPLSGMQLTNLVAGDLGISGTSATTMHVTSTTTGTTNAANIFLQRGDQNNGYARIFNYTGATPNWSAGLRPGSDDYFIFDEQNAIPQVTITPGTGTLGMISFAGGARINALTASSPVFTDGSKNLSSSGIVNLINGGLGFTTATKGDLFYASNTDISGKLSDVAIGSVLTSGGVGELPVYSTTPSLNGMTLTGLNASGILSLDSSKNIISTTTPTSWTPVIGDGTNNFSVSGGSAVGTYHKIGPLVFTTAQIVWTSKGSAVAGNPLILSLPIAQGASPALTACSIGYSQGIGYTGSQLESYVNTGSSQVLLNGFSNTGTGTLVLVSNASTTGNVVYSCIYSAV